MATIPIFNPVVPFLGQIPGGFRPSLMIRLKGKIIGSYGRCQIDLKNSPVLNSNENIMFHISIRPRDGVIVRNHLQNGQWGMEERYGPCRIRKNETFEIIILAELQHYKIAVNGHHLGVFRHRLPLNFVQFLHVSGDVAVDHILLEQDTRSAQEQIIMSHVSTPSMNMPVQVQMHTPMQVHHPPPPYFSQQPPHSSITRIGPITIERSVIRHRPGTTVFVKQNSHSSNVYRF